MSKNHIALVPFAAIVIVAATLIIGRDAGQEDVHLNSMVSPSDRAQIEVADGAESQAQRVEVRSPSLDRDAGTCVECDERVPVDLAELCEGLAGDTKQMVFAALADGALEDGGDWCWLESEAAQAEFRRVWQEKSEPVQEERAKQKKVGQRVSRARFDAGECEEILVDESERQHDGGFKVDKLMEKWHPDEWVSTKMLYRKGGGQRFLQVRIMPGEVRELDSATVARWVAEENRREAIRSLVARARR